MVFLGLCEVGPGHLQLKGEWLLVNSDQYVTFGNLTALSYRKINDQTLDLGRRYTPPVRFRRADKGDDGPYLFKDHLFHDHG